jgi:hypothetical protein
MIIVNHKANAYRNAALGFVLLSAIPGTSLLQAQSSTAWQLNSTVNLIDLEKNNGSLIQSGKVIVLGFHADGGGGYLTLGENYPDETKVNSSGAVYTCAAVMVKTTYSWTFAPNVTYLATDQKATLTLGINQGQSCHNRNAGDPSGTFMEIQTQQNATDYEPSQDYASNPEGRYYVSPPSGLKQTNVKTIAITPANSFPTASFYIAIHCDSPVAIDYAYSQVTTTLASDMESWVRSLNDGRFGAAEASTFEMYTDWQPGWVLCELDFAFRDTVTPVFMSYQTSNPSAKYLMYWDPDTQKYTSWVLYNAG